MSTENTPTQGAKDKSRNRRVPMDKKNIQYLAAQMKASRERKQREEQEMKNENEAEFDVSATTSTFKDADTDDNWEDEDDDDQKTKTKDKPTSSQIGPEKRPGDKEAKKRKRKLKKKSDQAREKREEDERSEAQRIEADSGSSSSSDSDEENVRRSRKSVGAVYVRDRINNVILRNTDHKSLMVFKEFLELKFLREEPYDLTMLIEPDLLSILELSMLHWGFEDAANWKTFPIEKLFHHLQIEHAQFQDRK